MRLTFSRLIGAVAFGLILVAACGDDFAAAEQCNDALDSCPGGETCWMGGSRFDCYPSGAGQEGDSCRPTDGSPTCADGLFCLSLSNREDIPPQCVPRCLEDDPSPCGGGACERITIDAETGSIWVCLP